MLDFQIYEDKDKQVWFVLKKWTAKHVLLFQREDLSERISAGGSLGEHVGPVLVQF